MHWANKNLYVCKEKIKLALFLFLFFLLFFLLLVVGVNASANAVVPPPGPGLQTRCCNVFEEMLSSSSPIAVALAGVGKVGDTDNV